GGNDTVTVDVNGTSLVNVPILFDGGGGTDTLFVQGTPTTPVDEVIYAPGPDVNRGQLLYENVANARLMTIEFLNLEPVFDFVPSTTLTVNGTNSDNFFDYRASGAFAGAGRVSVDTYERIEFSNKANLLMRGFAGNDQF